MIRYLFILRRLRLVLCMVIGLVLGFGVISNSIESGLGLSEATSAYAKKSKKKKKKYRGKKKNKTRKRQKKRNRKKGTRSKAKKSHQSPSSPPSKKADAAVMTTRLSPLNSDGSFLLTEKKKIAVIKLGALGLDVGMAKNLHTLLHNSLDTIDLIDVISTIDIDITRNDPAHPELIGCDGGRSCALKIGAAVAADIVVFGSVAALGDNFTVNLRAYDVASTKEIAKEIASISGSKHLLIPEMRLAAFRLLAPTKITGSLRLEIDATGMEIFIDKKSYGLTPLAKDIEGLTPGVHEVEVNGEGYAPMLQKVTIQAFETARLKVDLQSAE